MAPAQTAALFDAFKAGELAKARELHYALLPLMRALFTEANPIPVKWALYEMGLMPEGIRLPLTPLSKQFHKVLRTAMREAGVLS